SRAIASHCCTFGRTRGGACWPDWRLAAVGGRIIMVDERQGSDARPYLNTRQAAHRLCMSARKLEAMRSAGEGPRFRRHGRLVFYHIDDLEIWSRGTTSGLASASPRNKNSEDSV